jgi:hypothetical protein
MQTTRGRQSRSDMVSTAIGAATKRSRAMFSPIGDDTANATVHATRYAANIQRSARASATRQVSAMPSRQKVPTAANSAVENGNFPCAGNIRCTSSSTPPSAAIAAAGATNAAASRRRATAMPTSTTTRRTKASGLAASAQSASTANHSLRPCWSVHSASKANAQPSMNGKAADTTSAAQATAKTRIDQRLRAPHSCRTTAENAATVKATVSTASSLIPSSVASG